MLAGAALGAMRLRLQQLTADARLVASERDRIARELHDRHLQELVGALMLTRRLRGSLDDGKQKDQSAEVVNLLERSSASARATIRMLAPPDDSRAIAEQVRFHAQCSGNAYGIPVVVSEVGERFRLRDQQRRYAVRIINEAVMNALKHSQAAQIEVCMQWYRARLEVTISDDGVGFREPAMIAEARSAEASREAISGLGLGNMHQLARAIGARLSISSNAEEGVEVLLRVRRPPLWSPDRWRAAPLPMDVSET